MYGFNGASDPQKRMFGSTDFAVGVVRGARTWRTNERGLLRGIYYPQTWHAGENHARCRKVQPIGTAMMVTSQPMKLDSEFDEPEPGHILDCRCGFYGYFDGSNDYYKPTPRELNYVAGVVEGYGETLIGTKGFRAMKARIVALQFPDTQVVPQLILENYPDIPIFTTFENMMKAYPPSDGNEEE